MEYIADPSTTDVPLRLPEIEELAAGDGKVFAKDTRKVQHLMRRMLATVLLYKNQIHSLNSSIQELQLSTKGSGAQTTMAPRDALKFLSPAEIAEVAGGTAQMMIEHAGHLQAEAAEAKRSAHAERSRTRLALFGVIEDPSLPAALRARIEAVLAELDNASDDTVTPENAAAAEPAAPDSSGPVQSPFAAPPAAAGGVWS